jgi:HSP20 family molecular chaperone IbpA
MEKKQDANVERVSQAKQVSCAVDIYEGPHGTRVYADMPGVSRDGIEVHVENNELHLKGRTKALFSDEPIEMVRAFKLGPGVDTANVTATMKDGVLVLELPKSPELKPRKIDVKVA